VKTLKHLTSFFLPASKPQQRIPFQDILTAKLEGWYPITALSTAALTAARGAMLPALAANAS
jgi:hypothetical protein